MEARTPLEEDETTFWLTPVISICVSRSKEKAPSVRPSVEAAKKGCSVSRKTTLKLFRHLGSKLFVRQTHNNKGSPPAYLGRYNKKLILTQTWYLGSTN